MPPPAAKILLTLTDRAVSSSYERALTQAGYTLYHVDQVSTLLDQVRQIRPDVVVINLPEDRLYTLCQQVTASVSAPVLLITPDSPDAFTRADEAGAADCLPHTTDAAMLVWRVRWLLTQQGKSTASFDHLSIEQIDDAVFYTDVSSGRILDVNRRATRLTGYSRADLLALPFDALSTSLGNGSVSSKEQTTQGHLLFENFVRTRSGQLIPVEVSSRMIERDGQKIVLNLMRDIRPRKVVEQAVVEQRHLAEALRDTAVLLNSTLQIDEIIRRVLEHVHRVLPSESANVMLLEEQRVRIIGAHGAEWFEKNPDWTISGLPLESLGAVRWMYSHRQPLLLPNTTESPLWHYTSDTAWIQSYLGAPILFREMVLGFINLDGTTPHFFNEQQKHYLAAFASQVGVALRNAQLYTAVQRHAAELEKHVIQRTEELLEANLTLKEQVEERQRIESALREERMLLRTLIDALPDHIYVKDINSRFALGNVAVARYLGLSSVEALIGRSDFDFMPPAVAAQFRKEEEDILTGRVQRVNREQDAQYELDEWLYVTKLPLYDSQGKIIGLVGINRDVSDFKRAEENLRHVVRGANCMLGYTLAERQVDGRIFWNYFVSDKDAALAFLPLDVRPDETYEDAYWRNIPQADKDSLSNTFRIAVEQNRSNFVAEFTCRRRDGELRWLLISVHVKTLSPDHWNLISVCIDVTDRKRLETAMQQTNELLEQRVAERTAELSNANLALTESEARFRALVEHAPEAIIVFDVDTHRFIAVNNNACKLFGLSQDQMFLKSPYDLSPEHQPDGRLSSAALHDYILAAVRGETPVFEWAYQHVDGRLIPCEMRLLLLPDSRNALVRGSITDITQRKLAEQVEHEQCLLTETLSAAARELSLLLDLDAVLDRVLDHLAKVMPPHVIATVMLCEDDTFIRSERERLYSDSNGYTYSPCQRLELISIPKLHEMMRTDEPMVIEALGDENRCGSAWTDPTIVTAVCAPIHAEGRIIGFVLLGGTRSGQFTPIHARWLLAFTNQAGIAIQNARLYNAVQQNAIDLRVRVAERTAELEAERAQLQAILDGMTEGVIYLNSAGEPIYVNQSFIRLTGHSVTDWVEQAASFFVDDGVSGKNLALFDIIRNTVNASGIWRGEARIRHADGEVFDARLVATSVQSPSDTPAGAVLVIRDVSQEKRLEAQKSRFIATASHELRTPLTNIKTRLYLLERQPDKLDVHLPVLRAVADRMHTLLFHLLDVSRFEHGIITLAPEPVHLQALLAQELLVQETEASKKDIRFTHTWPSDPLFVYADPERMKQVLTNLMTNAINYTPNGGRIDVRLRQLDDRQVMIQIEDNGIGIAPDLLPTIFQPFVRASEFGEGTGLGLTITREIVELHGGHIDVASTVGRGTCFSVYLQRMDGNQIRENR